MKTFFTYNEAYKYSNKNPSETVEYKDYLSNGQLWEHSFYRNGKKHGEYKTYQENGQLGYHCFYVNGLYNGEYKLYHENGKLRIHYFFVNGKRHGECISYYSDSQLCSRCFYVADEEINVDHLRDGSYKSRCILITLFDGNVIDEDI